MDTVQQTSLPQAQTPVPQDDRLAHEQAFIDELKSLDNGRLAMLRRNAGNTLEESREVNWFYGLLGRHAGRWNEDAYFLTATLFALDKDGQNGGPQFQGDIGRTMRMLKQDSKTSPAEGRGHPLDRRFNILLDADYDPASGGELSFRLRQTVRLIISRRDGSTRIDWPQLLYDLKNWKSDRKFVQKKWALSYYAPFTEGPAGSNGEEVSQESEVQVKS